MLNIKVGSEPHQELLIPFEDDFITIELKFLGNFWIANIKFKEKEIYGLKLSSKVLMLDGHNLPFEIMVDDLGSSIDPYQIDDFTESRFELNIVERSELEALRGFEVQ